MHAIVTLTICCVAFDIAADQIEKDLVYSVVCRVLVAYTGLVTICLGSFCAYQITGLSLRNIASNEDIRHRWNGHRRNKKHMKIFKKEFQDQK